MEYLSGQAVYDSFLWSKLMLQKKKVHHVF